MELFLQLADSVHLFTAQTAGNGWSRCSVVLTLASVRAVRLELEL